MKWLFCIFLFVLYISAVYAGDKIEALFLLVMATILFCSSVVEMAKKHKK